MIGGIQSGKLVVAPPLPGLGAPAVANGASSCAPATNDQASSTVNRPLVVGNSGATSSSTRAVQQVAPPQSVVTPLDEKKCQILMNKLSARFESAGLDAANNIVKMLDARKDDIPVLEKWGQTPISVRLAFRVFSQYAARRQKEQKEEAERKKKLQPSASQKSRKRQAGGMASSQATQDDDSQRPRKKTKEEIAAEKAEKERKKKLQQKKAEIEAKHDEDAEGGPPGKKKKMTKEEKAEAKRLQEEENERIGREEEARLEAARKKFESKTEEEKEEYFNNIKAERIKSICREMDEQMEQLLNKPRTEGVENEANGKATNDHADTSRRTSGSPRRGAIEISPASTPDDSQEAEDEKKPDDSKEDAEMASEEDSEKKKNDSTAIDPEERRKYYMKLVHRIEEEVTGQNMPRLKVPLMEHQVEALQWLLSIYNNTTGGLLADEMGLGKTASIISFLAYLREHKKNFGPHLIVVPKTVLQNWQNEIRRFYPALADDGFVVYQGNVDERDELDDQILERLEQIKAGDKTKSLLILTNYEMVKPDKNFMLLEPEYEVVIVDEAQRMKSAKTQFSQVMAQKVSAKKKLLMTGTPLSNRLSELWCLLNYILPDLFESSQEFEEWFSAPFREEMDALHQIVAFTEDEEAMLTKNLHAMLAPFMLKRMKSEVFGEKMPPCTQKTIRISLSHWQRKLYHELQEKSLAIEETKQQLELRAELGGDDDATESQAANSLAELRDEKRQAQHEMSNIMMQMRKCAIHPFLFSNANQSATLNLTRTAGKFEVLERVLAKLCSPRVDHKVLLFSQFTSCLDIIEDFLEAWHEKITAKKNALAGPKHAKLSKDERSHFPHLGYLRIDGQVSAKERQKLIDEFTKTKNLKIMLLSAKAASVGINLQCADTVIIFDQDWNPQNDRQAIGRAHRVGQTREVRVLRFITTCAVEEIMEQRCREKLDMEQKIIGAGGFNTGLNKEAPKDHPMTNHAAVIKMIQDAKEAAAKGAVASKYDDGGHVSKFPPTTVPELNQMLSRTPEEVSIYEDIDKENFFPNGTFGASAGNSSSQMAKKASTEEELDALTPEDRMKRVAELSEKSMDALVAANRLLAREEVPEVMKLEEDSEDDESME
ncbi:unnamed protein product [Amoebophrya sp. A25]|nr:unnamed protein product [Amoebophrya sp. A25]|eukprot:GSA25T00013442001.1